MVLTENPQNHSTGCGNDNNGTVVACNDAGHCNGVGTGPMPRLIGTASGVLGSVVGAAREELVFSGTDGFGTPTGSAASPSGPHYDIGQWHANPKNGGMGTWESM